MISTGIYEKKTTIMGMLLQSLKLKKSSLASVTGVFPAFVEEWFRIMEKHQLKIEHSWL